MKVRISFGKTPKGFKTSQDEKNEKKHCEIPIYYENKELTVTVLSREML